jgi:hypothetical protein
MGADGHQHEEGVLQSRNVERNEPDAAIHVRPNDRRTGGRRPRGGQASCPGWARGERNLQPRPFGGEVGPGRIDDAQTGERTWARSQSISNRWPC